MQGPSRMPLPRVLSSIVLGIFFAAVASAQSVDPIATTSAAAFDARPWLEDLNQTQQTLATKYANLEWVVFERELNLAALFAETKERIETASSASEARAALDRLARKLGDGHVEFQWRAQPAATEPPTADCAALGYDAQMFGAPVAALAPGYLPLPSPVAAEFPAGILKVGAHKVGVIKIGIFTPQGVPALCAAALTALRIPQQAQCDEACADRIEAWASNQMTIDLANQLRALKAAGSELMLVDLANNGGGTEWAEAAARMVTAVQLKSERLGFVRGAHWSKALLEQEAELRADAEKADEQDRAFLVALAEKVADLRREAETPCDSSALWRGEHLACRWLVGGLFSTGLMESASARVRGKPWARHVFKPAQFNYPEAVWDGPVIVLVNAYTGSAAEEFTAVLQDNHAAVVLGAPTGGAGCGHTDGGTPTTLNNSGGVLEVPDCARFRPDGSNEVMGIQPDVLVGLRTADGPHRQALRMTGSLPEAVERALRLHGIGTATAH
jgi:C-terminal processing protease CtpA/Prc